MKINSELIFCICYLVIQITGLSYQPLPWFDETYFANIAQQFIESGELKPSVAVFEEVKIYGFIYFLLTGASIKFLGLSIWSFRIINFLMGMANLAIIWKLFILINPQKSHLNLFLICLLALDPFFNLCLHEGRMDLTALFFMLSAYYLIQKYGFGTSYGVLLCISLLISLAFLTTPRVGVLLPGFFIWIISKESTYPFFVRVKTFALIIGGLMLFYSIWIFYAFGGFFQFLNYYLYPTFKAQNASMAELFIGGDLYIPRQEYLLILTSIVLFLLILWRDTRQISNQVLISSIFNIILFYLIIKDYGPYSIFILPFYYLGICKMLEAMKFRLISLPSWMLLLLLIQNSGYVVLKNLQTFVSFDRRNFVTIERFVNENIPNDSRVVGEPLHYYAVKKSGADFQYINLFEHLKVREKRHRLVYQYEYLVISDHLRWREPGVVAYYLDQGEFEEVNRLTIPEHSLSKQIDQLGLISSTERRGYNCVIYKRIIKEP